jgi:hypothetical protein
VNANVLELSARKRQDPIGVADPSDFEYSEGAAIEKIIEYCGLPGADMEAVYRVFEKDSQAGSV